MAKHRLKLGVPRRLGQPWKRAPLNSTRSHPGSGPAAAEPAVRTRTNSGPGPVPASRAHTAAPRLDSDQRLPGVVLVETALPTGNDQDLLRNSLRTEINATGCTRPGSPCSGPGRPGPMDGRASLASDGPADMPTAAGPPLRRRRPVACRCTPVGPARPRSRRNKPRPPQCHCFFEFGAPALCTATRASHPRRRLPGLGTARAPRRLGRRPTLEFHASALLGGFGLLAPRGPRRLGQPCEFVRARRRHGPERCRARPLRGSLGAATRRAPNPSHPDAPAISQPRRAPLDSAQPPIHEATVHGDPAGPPSAAALGSQSLDSSGFNRDGPVAGCLHRQVIGEKKHWRKELGQSGRASPMGRCLGQTRAGFVRYASGGSN